VQWLPAKNEEGKEEEEDEDLVFVEPFFRTMAHLLMLIY